MLVVIREDDYFKYSSVKEREREREGNEDEWGERRRVPQS